MKIFNNVKTSIIILSIFFNLIAKAEDPKPETSSSFAEVSKSAKYIIKIDVDNSTCLENGGKISFATSKKFNEKNESTDFAKSYFAYTSNLHCTTLLQSKNTDWIVTLYNNGNDLLVARITNALSDTELTEFDKSIKELSAKIAENAKKKKDEEEAKLAADKKAAEDKAAADKLAAEEEQKKKDAEGKNPPVTSVGAPPSLGQGVYANDAGDKIKCKKSWIFRNKFRCSLLSVVEKMEAVPQKQTQETKPAEEKK